MPRGYWFEWANPKPLEEATASPSQYGRLDLLFLSLFQGNLRKPIVRLSFLVRLIVARQANLRHNGKLQLRLVSKPSRFLEAIAFRIIARPNYGAGGHGGEIFGRNDRRSERLTFGHTVKAYPEFGEQDLDRLAVSQAF